MEIERLVKEYQQLNLSQTLNYDKFSHHSITHHSTCLEGSTLTEIETGLLLDEGLTPKGKPVEHSLMTLDHASALSFIIESAEKKKDVTPTFIQQINAKVMAKTGKVYQTVFGELDSSKGNFRKGNVMAGSRYFPNFDKVELLTKKLCDMLATKIKKASSITDQLILSFDAHFELVSIHPFYDGNGRTSRLLMNYIQHYYHLPMAIVFKEDKAEYIQALEDARHKEDLTPFRNFMAQQYENYLTQEIQNFRNIK
jgi:Fic family protein